MMSAGRDICKGFQGSFKRYSRECGVKEKQKGVGWGGATEWVIIGDRDEQVIWRLEHSSKEHYVIY